MARTLHGPGAMRFGWRAGLVLAVTLTASSAMAGQEQDARAIEAEALSSMRAGEIEAAYLLALEADALGSTVVTRWLVAIGADGLGKRDEAVAAYEGLLREGSLPAVRAEEARRRVRELASQRDEPPKKEPPKDEPPKDEPPNDEPEPPKEKPKPPPAPSPPEPPPPPPPMPDPGPAPLTSEEGPGATAIGLRAGGFVALAGTFGSGGALLYYALAARTATNSSAGYVNGVYAQRLIPVTAGLGAAALVMLPLGYLVDWDDSADADARAASSARVSFVPGPGEAGLGLDVRF